MPRKDPREMTIRELGELAELIRTEPTESKRLQDVGEAGPLRFAHGRIRQVLGDRVGQVDLPR